MWFSFDCRSADGNKTQRWMCGHERKNSKKAKKYKGVGVQQAKDSERIRYICYEHIPALQEVSCVLQNTDGILTELESRKGRITLECINRCCRGRRGLALWTFFFLVDFTLRTAAALWPAVQVCVEGKVSRKAATLATEGTLWSRGVTKSGFGKVQGGDRKTSKPW